MKTSKNTITLDCGEAELMGDGVAVLLQRDERGTVHSVAVTAEDLRRLLRAVE